MYLLPEQLKGLGFKKIGFNVMIDDSVSFFNVSNISIGSNVRIDGRAMITAKEPIIIGDHVHISWGCQIYGDSEIRVGDFSGLAPNVILLGSTDDYVFGSLTNATVDSDLRDCRFGNIEIGKHCIIGTNSVVMPGVKLHEGAAVGALSLVTKDIAEFTIASGNPAEKIGVRLRQKIERNEKIQVERSLGRASRSFKALVK